MLAASSSVAAPIPTELKPIVAFVFAKNPDGSFRAVGTAFFVGVPDPLKKNTTWIFLISVRHVIDGARAPSVAREIYVRLNLLDGKSRMVAIATVKPDGKQLVRYPKDETIDLAVIPFLPDMKKYEFKYIPLEMITTKADYEELNIREGSDVFFMGLFTPFHGAQRNYPIVRFGRVAMVTDENGSYRGNSGSPVFFHLGSDRKPGVLSLGGPTIKLAGVMKGAFLDRHPLQEVETDTLELAPSNMGISAVVPAYQLHELLLSAQKAHAKGR